MADPTILRFDLGLEIAQLRLRSQAGIVLVSAAALDGSLRNVLLTTMNLSDKKAEQMFAATTAVHFSPKFEIACAFKVIDDGLYNDLSAISAHWTERAD